MTVISGRGDSDGLLPEDGASRRRGGEARMSIATVASDHVSNIESNPSERKRYWVLPGLQARLVGWLVAISAVVATSAALAVLMAVWVPLSRRFVWAGNAEAAEALFWDASMRVFITTGCLIAIFALVAFVAGVIISHRVAGPLHRLERIARGVANGRYDVRATLRRGDYVHEFAEAFNGMLTHVQGRIGRHEALLARLDRELSDLAAASREGEFAEEALKRKLHEALRLIRDSQADDVPA